VHKITNFILSRKKRRRKEKNKYEKVKSIYKRNQKFEISSCSLFLSVVVFIHVPLLNNKIDNGPFVK